jgi:hypothetical protein
MQVPSENEIQSPVLSPSKQMALLELKLRFLDCKDLQTIPEVEDEHHLSFFNAEGDFLQSESAISPEESVVEFEGCDLDSQVGFKDKISRLNTIHSLSSQLPGTEVEFGESRVVENKSAGEFGGMEIRESIYVLNVANSSVFDSKDQLIKIDRPFENNGYAFEQLAKGAAIVLDGYAVAQSRPIGDVLVFKAVMEDNRSFKFKIINKSSKFLAIGACQKSLIESRRYFLNKSNGNRHGCFMFRSDGYRFKSGSGSTYHFWSSEYVQMKSGDVVLLKLVKSKRSLYLLNKQTGVKAKLPIDAGVDLDDFYPCICLPNANEEVDIIPFKHQFGKLIDPDHIKQNPNYTLCGNRISRVTTGDLALLSTPVTPDIEFKFRIESKPSHEMAIGICMKSLADGNGFLVGKNRNHGCWLFYSDGDIQVQGEPFRKSATGSDVHFAQNQELVLSYDSKNARLFLFNLSTGKSSSIKLSLRKSVMRNFYPCVRLGRSADKVSIAN